MASAHIGTSGFSYKEWVGSFYPPGLAQAKWLGYYASRFAAVEIDSTFYRMPKVEMLDKWKRATPEGFAFAIKASRRITHNERLAVPSDATSYFLSVLPSLGDRLGVVLFQLPPFFHCDERRLDAFLSTLPAGVRFAVEFRHPSWFVPDVYARLEDHRVALCINEGDDGCTPIRTTAPHTYVRLRRQAYSTAARREWQTRFRQWLEQKIEVYAFVKHEGKPDAPGEAQLLAGGLAPRSAVAPSP
jgi:uncharacterized protein YecE (DUF72 family)